MIVYIFDSIDDFILSLNSDEKLSFSIRKINEDEFYRIIETRSVYGLFSTKKHYRLIKKKINKDIYEDCLDNLIHNDPDVMCIYVNIIDSFSNHYNYYLFEITRNNDDEKIST